MDRGTQMVVINHGCMHAGPSHGRLSGRSLIRSDELGLALSKLAHAIAIYFDFGCLLIIR